MEKGRVSLGAFMLKNVPIQRDKRAGYCLITSTYMVLDYWHSKGFFESEQFPIYQEFSSNFDRMVDSLGFPPNKLRDYITKLEGLQNVRVRHRIASDIGSMEAFIRNERPPIVLFDFYYYQQRVESKSQHATVLTGYTEEIMYANDPLMGEGYPYEKKRFVEAWRRKGNKYILIEPIRQLRLPEILRSDTNE